MDQDSYRALQTQTGVSQFWADKHAREAHKNWDKFYRRNAAKFYKDRHWTTSESSDGFSCLSQPSSHRKILVEAGCGVANCAFPLLDINPSMFVYAFDFAPTAINIVTTSPRFSADRIRAFVWDFCRHPIQSIHRDCRGDLDKDTADLCTLVFVLSAVPPDLQLMGLKNLYYLIKPGGRLLFRDYATGDLAQKRFSPRNRIHNDYFVRQDSTLSFFFGEEKLREHAVNAGFDVAYIKRVTRVVENRKENREMNRVFLQAEFVKGIPGT